MFSSWTLRQDLDSFARVRYLDLIEEVHIHELSFMHRALWYGEHAVLIQVHLSNAAQSFFCHPSASPSAHFGHQQEEDHLVTRDGAVAILS